MNKPAVSIILPFYNAQSTLSRAINSISRQTFTDFECILVDNNSSDKSLQIATSHCLEDNRFKLCREPRQGVAFAHNAALAIAKGKYIARMDADDWMFPDRLESQYHFLEGHPEVDVLAGLAEYVPHSEDTAGFHRYVQWSNGILDHVEISKKRFVESPVINPTAMWRREISDQFGSYIQGDFPEDYELWLRWLDKGVKFHKLNKQVIKWYDSAKRLTRTDSRYSDQAFFRIKTKYLAKWLASHNPHHPDVAVWGASKISRSRAKILENEGLRIRQYIDISKKRQLDRTLLFYKDIPDRGQIFILVYLKEETMKSNTIVYLEKRGYAEGVDFMLVS